MHNGRHLDRELYPLRTDAVRVHHIRYAAVQRGRARRLLLRVARWSDNTFHAGNGVSCSEELGGEEEEETCSMFGFVVVDLIELTRSVGLLW